MTAPEPKGWCPTLFRPMRSADGWLVRVRPPAGVLHASDARALVAAAVRAQVGGAARDGIGTIELTNRAALQIRGLREAALPQFAATMVELGLAHPDPDVEQRRQIIVTPLAGDDPAVSRHVAPIAHELGTRLQGRKGLKALPPKFGFLVDGGGILPVASGVADIRILLDGDACRVSVDCVGEAPGFACAPEDAAAMAVGLADAFVNRAAVCPASPRRMRTLIQAIGASAVFAAAGLAATRAQPRTGALSHMGALPGTEATEPSTAPNPIGWLPYGQSGQGAFGVGLPFGAMDMAALTALADLSEQLGDGTLRMTPWRCLMIPRVTQPDLVSEAVTRLGLIVQASDPRLRVFACPGLGACGSATVASRVDAGTFASLGISGTLHVSGCAKGCAHPGTADMTLVGQAGRYDIVRHGRAADVPALRGVAAGEVASLFADLRQQAVA